MAEILSSFVFASMWLHKQVNKTAQMSANGLHKRHYRDRGCQGNDCERHQHTGVVWFVEGGSLKGVQSKDQNKTRHFIKTIALREMVLGTSMCEMSEGSGRAKSLPVHYRDRLAGRPATLSLLKFHPHNEAAGYTSPPTKHMCSLNVG